MHAGMQCCMHPSLMSSLWDEDGKSMQAGMHRCMHQACSDEKRLMSQEDARGLKAAERQRQAAELEAVSLRQALDAAKRGVATKDQETARLQQNLHSARSELADLQLRFRWASTGAAHHLLQHVNPTPVELSAQSHVDTNDGYLGGCTANCFAVFANALKRLP